MKRIVSMLIAILMIANSSLAYTTTVKAKGLGMVITSGVGNTVMIIPKTEEIKGWEVEEGNIEVVNNQFTMPEENVKIKAILEGEATYLFKLIFPYFTNEENRVAGETISVEALTENEGYVFKSWTSEGITLTAEQQVNASITFTMPSNAVTLTANYEDVIASTYNVTFDANGGTGTMSSQTFTQGVAQNLTANSFTREGYTFIGWSTTADGTVEYANGTSYTATGNITLYAVWTQFPVLASQDAWFTQGNSDITRRSITSIELIDSYTSEIAVASWDASEGKVGSITAYVEEDGTENGTYKLIIAGNGSGKIMANANSQSAFSDIVCAPYAIDERYDVYSKLESINGLNNFDTNNVTTMYAMFKGCSSLTSVDVSGFDTSNVTGMNYMFYNCSSLTSVDVSGFDTSNVTNMSSMFSGCSGLTSLDVSGFDTSNVTNMSSMFSGCSGLTSLDVSGFDTSNVTTMSYMFSGCSGLTSVDASGFDTSKVTTMSDMFAGCRGLTSVDVSNFNTSNVTTMWEMFCNCKSLTSIDVSGFDTSNVTTMNRMFDGCSSLISLDVSGFDTSNVTDMTWMFADCRGLSSVDVSKWETTNLVKVCSQDGIAANGSARMKGMFEKCYSLQSIDLSSWDMSKITNNANMFLDCTSLKRITIPSSAKVICPNFAYNCSSLVEINFLHENTDEIRIPALAGVASASEYYIKNTEGFDCYEDGGAFYVPNYVETTINTNNDVILAYNWLADNRAKSLVGKTSMFCPGNTWYKGSTLKNTITEINIVDSYTPNNAIESWDASINEDGSLMVYIEGTKLTIVGDGSGKIFTNADSSLMFSGNSTSEQFTALTSINGLNILDTSDTTVMEKMFRNCKNLTSLDLSSFETNKVTNMSRMFNGCNNITEINLTNFDMSNISNNSMMFYDCYGPLTIYVGNQVTADKIKASSYFPSNATVIIEDSI